MLLRIGENNAYKAFSTESSIYEVCVTNIRSVITTSQGISNQGHRMVCFGSHVRDQQSHVEKQAAGVPPTTDLDEQGSSACQRGRKHFGSRNITVQHCHIFLQINNYM